MDVWLQTHLDEFRQKPASSLSYSQSLTLEMLKDLENLQQEGASDEEMQCRISATATKLNQHNKDIDREIERHHLEQQKEHYQTMLDAVQVFQDKTETLTEGNGDEWEKVEKA
ncbi:hypothetical protein N7471_010758 [Penicillium samsonianum]|uniref:uncharacterized protein n=1 Tax=Penicillium samsonianum TaxID=1882272 RepID=UPI002548A095|nr:uncharacterized protein N7471_010758 [Penicillium samsonianum]KAJ6126265.1 hypothetical protein N7471_010758 [Penicillium samsonianum]